MFENIVGFVCDDCAAKIHAGERVTFSEAVGWLESEGITDANGGLVSDQKRWITRKNCALVVTSRL